MKAPAWKVAFEKRADAFGGAPNPKVDQAWEDLGDCLDKADKAIAVLLKAARPDEKKAMKTLVDSVKKANKGLTDLLDRM